MIPPNTNDELMRSVAAQLRKPSGEWAHETGIKMNESNATLYANTYPFINPGATDHILEIGMGNGHFVPELITRYPGIYYTGCDHSPEMVVESRQHNQAWVDGGRARFDIAEASTLPYKPNLFNIIFSVNTLYFWEQPGLVMAELFRVLKPGGQLIIAIRPENIMRLYPFTAFGFKLYNQQSLHHLITSNGFLVKAVSEAPEPDQFIQDQPIKVASLVIHAQKPE